MANTPDIMLVEGDTRPYKIAMRKSENDVWEIMESYRTKKRALARIQAWMDATPGMRRLA